jgi:BirA family biotin operon repressor/biotin-[acetyl-CoA-carboxylase] ligase
LKVFVSQANEPEPLFSGWRVARYARLGSTSDEARRRALLGDPGRLWIVAGEQTQGRGRYGRSWRSLPGNLYASALVVDPCEAAIAPQIGFVAGVALVKAVEDLGGAGVALKWPNDLLWNGAKLAGLLVEGVSAPGRGLACVVGVGVNCSSSPRGLAYPTTDLRAALQRDVSPEALFRRLAARFHQAIGLWSRGAGFAEIRARWLKSAAGLGGPIRVAGAQGSREGVFEGLDADGRLLMRTAGALETIEAADIFLAPPADGAGGGPRPRAEILDESLDR